ncbi:MAG TPA: FAD-binding oxidoreductase, partial [Alcanivorax sp.]|nr:FAD-binding oxidoreductase [Alcanivorax sp.]
MTAHAHAALEQLTDLLGNRLLTDPQSAERYGVDWTKVWAPAPCAVALPETIDEVQQIVEIANDHGLHLVPSGGRTGLSAG